jgi:hypothetical protein
MVFYETQKVITMSTFNRVKERYFALITEYDTLLDELYELKYTLRECMYYIEQHPDWANTSASRDLKRLVGIDGTVHSLNAFNETYKNYAGMINTYAVADELFPTEQSKKDFTNQIDSQNERIEASLTAFKNDYYKPIMNAVKKIIEAGEISDDVVEDYESIVVPAVAASSAAPDSTLTSILDPKSGKFWLLLAGVALLVWFIMKHKK